MTTPNCLIPGRDARIDWQSPALCDCAGYTVRGHARAHVCFTDSFSLLSLSPSRREIAATVSRDNDAVGVPAGSRIIFSFSSPLLRKEFLFAAISNVDTYEAKGRSVRTKGRIGDDRRRYRDGG